MTTDERLTMLKAIHGEDDSDDTLQAYLGIAGSVVLNRLYPYDESADSVPKRYWATQCQIAEYLLNKRGAEGQTAHSENGISRSYGAAYVPEDLLGEIAPYCGVPM